MITARAVNLNRRVHARNPFLLTGAQFPTGSFEALTERAAELPSRKTIMGPSNEASRCVRSIAVAPRPPLLLTVCTPIKPLIRRKTHFAL
jgi:hypothetical protein